MVICHTFTRDQTVLCLGFLGIVNKSKTFQLGVRESSKKSIVKGVLVSVLVVLAKQMRIMLILIPVLVARAKPMTKKSIPQSRPRGIALFIKRRSYSRYGMLIFIKRAFQIVLRIRSEDVHCLKRHVSKLHFCILYWFNQVKPTSKM